MDVDAAVARRRKCVGRQDKAVGGHDQNIEIKRCECRLMEVQWLQNSGARLLRQVLHRTWPLTTSAAGRPVWLGEHHQRCQVVCVKIRQDSRGEFRRAGKAQPL